MTRTRSWLLHAALNGLLAFPMLAVADQPDICLTLTPDAASGTSGGTGTGSGTSGGTSSSSSTNPAVKITVYASNKPGSVSTFYGLNGSGSSTQGTKELFYLLSGTAYITTRNAIEASLAGTAVDSACGSTTTQGASAVECVRQATFHIVVDGTNDRYTQIVRTAGDQTEAIYMGAAAVSQGSCGRRK